MSSYDRINLLLYLGAELLSKNKQLFLKHSTQRETIKPETKARQQTKRILRFILCSNI